MKTKYNVQDILSGPLHYPIPDNDNEKCDVMDSLAESITQENENITGFLNYAVRMPPFITVAFCKKVYCKFAFATPGNKILSGNKVWQDFFIKHWNVKTFSFHTDISYFLPNVDTNIKTAYQNYLKREINENKEK